MYTMQTAIQDFLNHCTFDKNLSFKTVKAYRTDLIQFSRFLRTKLIYSFDVREITKTEIQQYVEYTAFLKAKSRKRKIATIKAMLNYLEFDDKIVSNPMRKVQIKIKEPFRLPRYLTINEINEIFKAAYNEYNKENEKNILNQTALRNLAIIELLFATGARVSEISNLKNDDIDLVTGKISIKGKGNKERIIQISNTDTIQLLNKYKQIFESKILEANNFFFINRLKSKLSDQSIRCIVKILSQKANITKKITPHVFRHSFATLLLENEVDIKYIQILLGHSSILTTQIYTHVNNHKINQILKTRHPRKDICVRLNNG
mgnify:CR=1 FL=1